MNNIRVKQESLNDWRSELKESTNCECEGCDCNPCVECGEDCHNLNEEIEGGINVQNVADGLNFTEIETVDIIKPEPIKGASNWQLEMAVESLISEGYNDDEIVTILTEELPKIPLGGIVTGAVRGAWNLSTKGVKGAYDLGKGVRGVVNRGVRDTKLTKDILDTAKKLRNPDNVSITKSPRVNTPSKGGGLVKSFKGFMQNVKDAGSNLANRTKGKLDRINAKKAEIQTTAKDVDVLGGAATTPKPTSTPMKNITPSPIGDGIKKVANQIKTGASAAAVTGGVVAGSKLTGGSSSKVSTATPTPPVEKKVEAPITNDGKKEVDPSKNEKIESQPTKRELRNKRNAALSSKEGKRARRDAALQKKKDSGFPSRRMKSGTPVNQLFNKEEVTNEDLTDFKNRSEITTKGKLNKGNFSASIKQLTDKEISDKLPTINGVKLEMDADGELPNMGKFVKDQAVSQANQFADSGIIDNNPEVAAAMSKKVGLEGPMTTDKFKDITKQGTKNLDFDINKNIQGTQANRLQNVANSINQSTSNNKPIIKNPKIKTVVQGSSSTRPMGEGFLSKLIKVGAGAFALKKGGEFLKKKGDEALDGARKNMKIGGDKRKSDIEKATGVKLDHYSWRDELGLIEGNRTRYKGVGLSGSGNKKDLSKGPNEKVFVDYTKIRANAPVKTDTKVG